MTQYIGDIEVKVTNDGKTNINNFENESFVISRSDKLAFIKKDDSESEFFDLLKIWNQMDKESNIKSYYNFKTSNHSPIESFRDYYIEKIVEDKRMIIFNWVSNT